MGFADEVAEHRASKGPQCAVGAILEDMDGDLRAEVLEVIDGSDRDYPANAVSRALAERGYRVGHFTISRHRRKDCACER